MSCTGYNLVVHLRTAEYQSEAVRRPWQQRGYATIGPMECHPPYVPCPYCSGPASGTPKADPPPRDRERR